MKICIRVAARTLSLLIVRAAGYRPRTVGACYNTYLALETADSAFAAMSALFRRLPD